MIRSGPRVVLVTRETPLEAVIRSRGTRGQAAFYMRSRKESIEPLERAHERFVEALKTVTSAIPPEYARTRIDRADLERFLFAPDDLIIVVGQDGLVPNVAKYLHGQLVFGVNPDPANYDGVLCRHSPEDVPRLLCWSERRHDSSLVIQQRIMAVAEREDGQRLRALNEVFIGHRTHQSAHYRIHNAGRHERQSSSGVICSTGTGSTGWARSVSEQRGLRDELPKPEDKRLVWFVREPFPSVATGTKLDRGGVTEREPLEIVSEMGEGGVIFADGIETDRVEFLSGQRVAIRVDAEPLRLVVPEGATEPRAETPRRSRAPRMVRQHD